MLGIFFFGLVMLGSFPPKTLACGSMRLLFLKVLTLCITYDVELSSKYKRDLIAVA